MTCCAWGIAFNALVAVGGQWELKVGSVAVGAR